MRYVYGPLPNPSVCMSRLCTKTVELLQRRPRTVTYKSIEEATGLKSEWLAGFANREFDDPGVKKVERLYEHLSGKRLKV